MAGILDKINSLTSKIDSMDWFPNYSIRKSNKAKRLHIAIKCSYVEIVLPKRSPPVPYIIDFIEQKQDWIQSNTKKDITLNQYVLNLVSVNQIWHIIFIRSTCHKKIKICYSQNIIYIHYQRFNIDTVKAKVGRWINKYAFKILAPKVEHISKFMNLSVNKLSIRRQKNIWGSCNSKQEITLNAKLLFLPEHLVNYVIIHELCHITHMNHSSKFWDMVRKYCPSYIECKESIRQLEQTIPTWL